MTTLPLRKSIGRSACRRAFILIALTLTCLALLPTAQTIPEPTPPPEKHVEGDLGNHNTVEGNGLSALTTGIDNTAVGFDALFRNTLGGGNTATGSQALLNNTTGTENTATGFDALILNTTGFQNTATGVDALFNNTNGTNNTANGVEALHDNTTGSNNAASGFDALFSNTTGSNNTANGFFALSTNTTGSGNIALGDHAGENLTTGNNNIDIGNGGVAGDDSTIRIGDPTVQAAKTFIAGIFPNFIPNSEGVVIDAFGHLGTNGIVSSSARFKDDITPMDKASEAILALKPVTFRYKKEIDPKRVAQFGLVAEEVEKVNPVLVLRDAKGEVSSVRYDAVNAMLLNEFLKEHEKVEQLEATAAHQQKEIEALTAGLQKVSAQVEVNKPAPQMVLNNQ